jgi:mRNA-degrading endonuclease HigB of HigAB toxin-antitoxin module
MNWRTTKSTTSKKLKKDEEQIKQLKNPEQIENMLVKSTTWKRSEDIYIIEFEGDSIRKIINLELLKIKIKMATNLFDDFDPVSSKQWKQKSSLNSREQITTKP